MGRQLKYGNCHSVAALLTNLNNHILIAPYRYYVVMQYYGDMIERGPNFKSHTVEHRSATIVSLCQLTLKHLSITIQCPFSKVKMLCPAMEAL